MLFPRIVAHIYRQRLKLTVLLLGIALLNVTFCLEDGLFRFFFEQIMSLVLYQRPFRRHHWNDAFNWEWHVEKVNFFGNQYCTLENKNCFNLDRCRKNPRSLYIYPHDASAVESFFRWAGGDAYERIHNTFQIDVINYLTNHADIDVISRPDKACIFLPRYYSVNN